jgi:CDP-diacylglycerol--serine O-phosphatidyltransferase
MRVKAHIPNAITCANLFCGLIAILFIMKGHAYTAAAFVGMAMVFDFLDGMVARLLKATSPIGKELDSLADMVSFGVVPGFILAVMLQASAGGAFPPAGWLDGKPAWYLLAFLIPVFSALRLAKFNLDSRQGDVFYGLATPANTLFILSLWLITVRHPESLVSSILSQSWTLAGITLLLCYMLISEIRLMAFKFRDLSLRKNAVRYLFILFSVILIAIFQFMAIPFVLLLYILLSLIQNRIDREV